MGVPKRKTSQSKRDKRRTHKKLTPPSLSLCPQCHDPMLPHKVCPHCGFYRGKEIVKGKEEK